ncbi:MAG: hypothetical protein K1X74_15795 [Pirellulales bacterium]|nr:hypothetical protein [Pirellulales bacterium]
MDLESRLLRVELRAARLRLLVGLLLLGLLGSWALQAAWIYRTKLRERTSQAIPEFVQARRFILVDPQGEETAVLGNTDQGPFLELNDQHGRRRAVLDVRSTGPGLTLNDARGTVRALLAVETGGPFLGLADDQGNDLYKAP